MKTWWELWYHSRKTKLALALSSKREIRKIQLCKNEYVNDKRADTDWTKNWEIELQGNQPDFLNYKRFQIKYRAQNYWVYAVPAWPYDREDIWRYFLHSYKDKDSRDEQREKKQTFNILC